MALSDEQKRALDGCIERYRDVDVEDEVEFADAKLSSDPVINRLVEADWKKKALSHLENNDPDSMLEETKGHLQYNVLDTAFNSQDDKVRLDASKFALGQMGRGEVRKTEHLIQYDRMPAEQLVNVIAGQLMEIQKIDSSVNIKGLLDKAEAIEAEVEEIE